MMFRRLFFAVLTISATALIAVAADPTATSYDMQQCEGSLTPYPRDIPNVYIPDSLRPVYLSHVGRHGSRYPASAASTLSMRRALMRADSIGTITKLGRELLALCDEIAEVSKNRWGALDQLGMSEQRAIASRMFANYPDLFTDGTVNALSSYSPRSMMSMFSFVHQLDRMNNKLTFNTNTGHDNNMLMRPFDVDKDYLTFRRENLWKPAYDTYLDTACPLTAIRRVLGKDYPYGDDDNARELAITEYYVVAGLAAMEMEPQMSHYFTAAEANALWSCFNLRQYLQRTATTVSTVPADIAAQLVLDIIQKGDNAVAGTNPATVDLRFGHAETVMPLVSLLRLHGCYYLTNYFDTVGLHWRDWDIVPMAANLQFVFFRAGKTGNIYVRTDLNERPVTLIPGDSRIYVPWGEARDYMMSTVPLHVSANF